MAQKVAVEYTCDSKDKQGHKQTSHAADVTVTFVISTRQVGDQGTPPRTLEIDLCNAQAEKMTQSFDRYVEWARPAGNGRSGNGGGQHRARTRTSRQRSGDIRAWAKEHGIAVSERGRIPGSVVAQYEAAGK